MAKPTASTSTQRHARRTTTPGRRAASAPASKVTWDIPLTSANLILLGVGIAVIVVGYLLMSSGIADDPLNNQGTWNNAASVTIAPILLGLGYCIIVPYALLYRKKGSVDIVESTSDVSSS